ncbi:hypothetical protein PG984_010025 [Apiospora sp. TS-2023a]
MDSTISSDTQAQIPLSNTKLSPSTRRDTDDRRHPTHPTDSIAAELERVSTGWEILPDYDRRARVGFFLTKAFDILHHMRQAA